jgi:hypothetical protein
MLTQDVDEELARVLSNPDNLIMSEALLERLPRKEESEFQKCELKIRDTSYRGNCSYINFQKDKLQISIELDSGEKKFKFIHHDFPDSFLDYDASIILSGEEKTIVGKLLEVSYDLSLNSRCIMSLELYNYQLEVPHG